MSTSSTGRSTKRLAIVGIGGSAGSLSALQELVSNLPAECPLGFVIVSHGDPERPTLLPEILGRSTRMPVHLATDGTPVEAGSIYVAPTGRHIALEEGVIRFREPVERGHPPLPIDFFLRSLAHDQGERAVGIVLSGTGSDGTLGLGAIQERAGLSLAQDPATAEFGAMPASAVARGVVDLVLPVAEMPVRLSSYTHGAQPQPSKERAEEPRKGSDLDEILSLVADRADQDFSAYKRGTLQRRIERRMGIHRIEHLSDYVRYLKEEPEEIDALWRDWLIGVSGFFRDREAFDALSDALSARIAELEDRSRLRVWVPGCATGEEAYSIAILVFEALERLHQQMEIQIFATDLDGAAIEFARRGRYPEGVAADVGGERLRRFFTPDDHHCLARKELRDCIVFAPQNLLRDPPFTGMDLISCRNLLIYLAPEAQRQVIPLLHYSLKPGGLLFLGTSESVTGFENLFEPVEQRAKLFRRRETEARADVPLAWVGARLVPTTGSGVAHSETHLAPPDYSDLLHRKLADRYAPPSVIVDEQGVIEQIHGRTGEFLEPAPGSGRMNVLEMAREGLRAPLSAALREAIHVESGMAEREARVRRNGDKRSVHVRVRRLVDPRLRRTLLMVSFEETPVDAPRPRPAEPATAGEGGDHHARLQLEDELRTTREDLQSAIEELQASNERLATASEEVQSVNEELQSTNEELLTSKEETQSLNEELQTVNAELTAKVEGLERTQDDLLNLVNATRMALVFLDEQLCVNRFTPEAQKIFRLIESDVGRPLADLATSLEDSDLIPESEQVLQTLVPWEGEVRTDDGVWWSAQIRPYRTSRNAIEGLVLTFSDITRVKQAAARAEEASRLFESIVDTVREPLLVLDSELRVLRANGAFYRTFEVTPGGETEGGLLYELGDGQWNIPELRRLLERVLPENESLEDYPVDHEFPEIGYRKMLLNARRIERESADDLILLAFVDTTERSEPESDPSQPRRARS